MRMAAATDATETARIQTCAARQAITMHGRTARTTDGRAITRDLRAAAATATPAQGAGLNYLLGVVHGIAIWIAIKMEIEIEITIETGCKIAIRIVPDKQ